MKKVIVIYYSPSGTTRAMADYIAEGVRIGGQEASVVDMGAINPSKDLELCSGIIVGCPTYFRDIPEPVKEFFSRANREHIRGKLAGAFGSITHDGNAPEMVLEELGRNFNMQVFELGALNLKEYMFNSLTRDQTETEQYIAGEVFHEGAEGIRACQDYGRVFAEDIADNS